MARGNVLTDRVRSLIAGIYLDHPNWRSSKIREELIKRLHGENPYYDDPEWPRLNTVQKELTKIRRRKDERLPESKELDTPWCTATIAKYPVTPEAVPYLLKLSVWMRENDRGKLTIREAQWAARFYAINLDIEVFMVMARGHALSERIGEMTGIPYMESFNSDLMAFGLMTKQEITPERERKILGLTEEQQLAMQELEKYVAGLKDDEGQKDNHLDEIVQILQKREANQ